MPPHVVSDASKQRDESPDTFFGRSSGELSIELLNQDCRLLSARRVIETQNAVRVKGMKLVPRQHLWPRFEVVI